MELRFGARIKTADRDICLLQRPTYRPEAVGTLASLGSHIPARRKRRHDNPTGMVCGQKSLSRTAPLQKFHCTALAQDPAERRLADC